MPKSKSAKTRFRALPVIRAACPLFRRSYYTRLARHDFLPVFHSDLSARWTVMSRQINRLSNFQQQRLVARRRIALAPSRIKLRITTLDKSRHAQVWAPKVPLPGGIRAPPEHASSGPMSHTLSGISIGSAVSAQLVVVTNKHTDRQRDHGTSVGPAIGRIFAFHARDTAIGATTTEKLERTSRGVDANPIPFLHPSLPRLPLLLHPCFSQSLPYSSFLLPLYSARCAEAL